MEVLAASDKLQLSKLRSACVDFLEQSVNVANACTILTASKQLNLVPLLKACTKFTLRNGKAVLESEGFKQLTKEAVVSIISSHNLHATEEEVFEAVISHGAVLFVLVMLCQTCCPTCDLMRWNMHFCTIV
jgi:hypothetical protein